MNVRQNVALALVAGSLLMVAGTAGAAAKVEEATSRSPGSAARSAPAAARGAGARGAAADDTPSGPMTPSETLGPASKGNAAASKPADMSRKARVPGMARYRSIGHDDVVMFDAPSDKAKKLYQAPHGMPVEIIAVLQGWVKVRDMQGDIAWVQRDDLSDRRTVIATTTATMLREPDQAAMPWFDAARGVVFELEGDALKPVDDKGFVRVHHADGQSGYVEAGQLWGI